MLGHLRPQFSKNKATSVQSYRNAYCGICASLRKNHSLPFGLLVNHELTIALLALRPFYKSETETIKTSCPAKVLLKKYQTEKHPVIDKAANFSLLLAKLKLTDIKADQKSSIAGVLLRTLDKKCTGVYESLCEKSKQVLVENLFLTKNNPDNFEIILHQSGLLSQVLVEELAQEINIDNENEQVLPEFFYKIGRIIPLADALTDWAEDSIKGANNPILHLIENENQSLEEAYYHYRKQFQSLLYELVEEVIKLQNPTFEEWLINALKRLENQVQKHSPTSTCSTSSFQPVLMRNDCDCDCDGDCCSCSCCSSDDDSSCSICDCCDSDSDGIEIESDSPPKKKKKNLENPD